MIIKRRLFGLVLGITAFIFLPYNFIKYLYGKFPTSFTSRIKEDVIQAINKTDFQSIISTWFIGFILLLIIGFILFIVIVITVVNIIPWLKGEKNEDYYM